MTGKGGYGEKEKWRQEEKKNRESKTRKDMAVGRQDQIVFRMGTS